MLVTIAVFIAVALLLLGYNKPWTVWWLKEPLLAGTAALLFAGLVKLLLIFTGQVNILAKKMVSLPIWEAMIAMAVYYVALWLGLWLNKGPQVLSGDN